MRRVLFDIEANAIEAELVTEVWSLVLLDLDTEDMVSVSSEDDPAVFLRALTQLAKARTRVGHNIDIYDFPVLTLQHPDVSGLTFDFTRDLDTLTMARLARPDLKGHSLEKWGERLGHAKDLFDDFARWSPELQRRCEQDVRVNFELYKHLTKEHPWLISAH